jgi:putative transposase
MIDPAHPQLSIVRQCRQLSIGLSTCYGPAKAESRLNLALMRRGLRPVSWARR